MINLIDLNPNCVHMKINPIYTLYKKYKDKNGSHLQFDEDSESKIYDLMVCFYNDQLRREVPGFPYITKSTLNVLYIPN